ncbi:MAG: DUF302 domain-containing protein [Gammaproteobacteria bacterium]|nr:DUF302 domain-containing protein [Gammaproteobacteria bacterium]
MRAMYTYFYQPDKHYHSKLNKNIALHYVINVLAMLGAIFLIVILLMSPSIVSVWNKLSQFDETAISTYKNVADTLIESGNPAVATVWRAPVKADMKIEDIEKAMDFVAAEYNLKRVGESILFDDKNQKIVESLTGVPYRYSKTYMYCNAVTAAKMFHHNPAYSAYTPCRITLIEDAGGQRWLYTLNIDMMIFGGTPLPDDLKQAALQIRNGIQAIMHYGATGEMY